MAPRRSDERLCVGIISGAFGVDGRVRIKSFTEVPEDIGSFGVLESEDCRAKFTLTACRPGKDGVTACVSGITSREQASALRGTKLYIYREALPELAPRNGRAEEDQPEEGEREYYHADLIGLSVRWLDEPRTNGHVGAVFNFGAGDLLEIVWPVAQNSDETHSILLPFDRESVPDIVLDEGYITALPPAGLMPDPIAKKRRSKPRKRKRDDTQSGK